MTINTEVPLLVHFLNLLPRDSFEIFVETLTRKYRATVIWERGHGATSVVFPPTGAPVSPPMVESDMREHNEAAYQSAKCKMPADLLLTVTGPVATGKSAILSLIAGMLREKGFDVRISNDDATGDMTDFEGPLPSIKLQECVAAPTIAYEPMRVEFPKHPIECPAAFGVAAGPEPKKVYTIGDVKAAGLAVKTKYRVFGKPLMKIVEDAIGYGLRTVLDIRPADYGNAIEAWNNYDPNKPARDALGEVVDELKFEVPTLPKPDGSYPDGNPKTAVGAAKLPLHLVPPIAVQHLAAAFKDGAPKYGPFNWRDQQVSSTVYYAAALRHLFAWFDGQEHAEDSGVHHLAHAMACMAIILDAESVGMLNDNRPTAGAAADMQKEFTA